MIIHGFAFWKFAKPAHEHHLQVCHPSQAYFAAFYHDLKIATTPNDYNNIFNLMESFFYSQKIQSIKTTLK